MLTNYFLIVSAVPGQCGSYNIWTLTLLGFSVAQGWTKRRVVTISLPPEGGAYTRALESENHYPRSVGGGAVDTNDWCINVTYRSCCSSTE